MDNVDINFHYFVVKALAIKAGFNDEEAQRIASYSQFIDDYDQWKSYYFKNIPEFMHGSRLISMEKDGHYALTPVTTGFEGLIDMAGLMLNSQQSDIVCPFHFITHHSLRDLRSIDAPREMYVTRPAEVDGTGLISLMLQEARWDYLNEDPTKPTQTRWNLLMKIGMLLHIFADTYAHQSFSGFQGAENFCYLESVYVAGTHESIIDAESPDLVYYLPSIGHANAGHAPDISYAVFKIKRPMNEAECASGKYTNVYQRSNYSEFFTCGQKIFSYLYQLAHGGKKPNAAEIKTTEFALHVGLKVAGTMAEMAEGWKEIVPATYKYAKEDQWQNLLNKGDYSFYSYYFDSAHDDFFLYNLYARQIHDIVHFGFRA